MSDMNTLKAGLVILFLMVLADTGLFAQEKEEKQDKGNKSPLLADIAGNIDEYKMKTLTLRLKLKHVDKIFEKITFYDKKNHSIEFDISTKEVKKEIAACMLNLHEGMDYSVTFTVQSVGKLGEVIGILKKFSPLVLDLIPEGGQGTGKN
jgi:hypothetical protein